MKYMIYVRPEALEDFLDVVKKNDYSKVTDWLTSRVRMVTQSTGGWVALEFQTDDWWAVYHNMDRRKLMSDVPY